MDRAINVTPDLCRERENRERENTDEDNKWHEYIYAYNKNSYHLLKKGIYFNIHRFIAITLSGSIVRI